MSQKELDTLRETLQKAGYNLTKPRQLVFELLLEVEPQSMRELVRKVGGRIDRASIYRTIGLFEQLDIVHRINIGWKYKLELSDSFMAHHHHLSCLKCGKLIDIHDDALVESFIAKVAAQAGFVPRRHQLEVDGLCKDCQNKL